MAEIPWFEGGPPPPEGLAPRSVTWDDLGAVATLLSACSPTHVSDQRRLDDLREQWLGQPQLSDAIVLEATGTPPGTPAVVAYAALTLDDDPWAGEMTGHLDVAVHPAWTTHRGGGFLLELARLGVSRAATVAGHPGATLRLALVDGDERARTWFTNRGFHEVRHLLDFRLDLHAPPPAPVWRAGIHARPFVPGRDEELLWRIHQRAFADVPTHFALSLEDFLAARVLPGSVRSDDHHGHRVVDAPEIDHHGPDSGAHQARAERGQADPELVLIAEHGSGSNVEAVGIAICHFGTPVTSRDGWIRDLGVVPRWRRHGIGMALLRTAFAAFRERELTGVALEVDDITLDGAAALYRRAGMRTVHRTDVLESWIHTRHS